MKRPLYYLHLLAVLVLAGASVSISGCNGDGGTTNPGDSKKVTDEDAAHILAASLGVANNGYLGQVYEAVMISRGDKLPEKQKQKERVILARIDTVIQRQKTTTIDGKAHTYDFKTNYIYAYTSANFNNERVNWTPGNKELKFIPTMTGYFDAPTVKSDPGDSGWVQVFYSNTDSARFTLNGKYVRVGRYTVKSNNRVVRGRVETALLNGLRVDYANKSIIDGDINISIYGKDADSNQVDHTGIFRFREGLTPTLDLNGKTYTFNPQAGTVTKR